MTERPILFSGEMVRAIIAGRKTQTRRIVKPQPDCRVDGELYWNVGGHRLRPTATNPIRCPYGQPGDRLWVRETWRRAYAPGNGSTGVIYRADAPRALGMDEYSTRHAWHPSIHMPRLASRITLEIVSVRAEWLNDISEADAMAEGGPPSTPSIDRISREFGYEDFPRSWFAQLWESINGPGSWEANPLVWRIEFRRV